jgi:16S rRNA (adenine1518-N6/adenine1519-N6)-dimethyltransferase
VSEYKKASQMLQKYQLKAKKKFGQNFLIDESVLDRIVEIANISNETVVIEIGPGLGALTQRLVKVAKHVISYEIDPDMISILKDEFHDQLNLTIIEQDILKADLLYDIKESVNDIKEVIVVANLPYYITSPIITKLISYKAVLSRVVIMMQKEVATRITATPKNSDFGYLSVMCQYHGTLKKAIDVNKGSFLPIPNVDSTVVLMEFYQQQIYHPHDEAFFMNMIQAIFEQKRKTLLNNLHTRYGFKKELLLQVLDQCQLSSTVRAEELSIEQMVALSNILMKLTR